MLWESRDVPQGVELSDAAASAPPSPQSSCYRLPPPIFTSLGTGGVAEEHGLRRKGVVWQVVVHATSVALLPLQ